MDKPLGKMMILASFILLVFGSAIDIKYGTGIGITGNILANGSDERMSQLKFFDVVSALIISFSIIGFTMGFMFMFRE